jgi:hypothetical protein
VPTFFQFFLAVLEASFSHWVLLRLSQSISLVFLAMFEGTRAVPELPTILPVKAIFCSLKPRCFITISAIVPTFFQFFLAVLKAPFSHWVLLRLSQSISLVFLAMFEGTRAVPELQTFHAVNAISCRLKTRVIITIRLKILLTIIFEIHGPLKFLVI